MAVYGKFKVKIKQSLVNEALGMPFYDHTSEANITSNKMSQSKYIKQKI